MQACYPCQHCFFHSALQKGDQRTLHLVQIEYWHHIRRDARYPVLYCDVQNLLHSPQESLNNELLVKCKKIAGAGSTTGVYTQR